MQISHLTLHLPERIVEGIEADNPSNRSRYIADCVARLMANPCPLTLPPELGKTNDKPITITLPTTSLNIWTWFARPRARSLAAMVASAIYYRSPELRD